MSKIVKRFNRFVEKYHLAIVYAQANKSDMARLYCAD